MEKIDLKIIKDHPALARLITVRLTVEELSQFAKALLKENEQEEKSQPQADELLTRKQIAILLKISLPTLHDYTKRGVIPATHLGTRIRYKKSDVLNALQRVETLKYKKG